MAPRAAPRSRRRCSRPEECAAARRPPVSCSSSAVSLVTGGGGGGGGCGHVGCLRVMAAREAGECGLVVEGAGAGREQWPWRNVGRGAGSDGAKRGGGRGRLVTVVLKVARRP